MQCRYMAVPICFCLLFFFVFFFFFFFFFFLFWGGWAGGAVWVVCLFKRLSVHANGN